MFAAIRMAITMLFTMFTTGFEAVNKLANAGNEMAGWCEEEAIAFNDKARIQRSAVLKQLTVKSDAQLAKDIRQIEKEATADNA